MVKTSGCEPEESKFDSCLSPITSSRLKVGHVSDKDGAAGSIPLRRT